MAKELKTPNVVIHSNSQLIINQTYQAKEEWMNNYLQVVKKKFEGFKTIHVKQIPITHNSHVDALARLATSDGIEEVDSIPIGRLQCFAIKKGSAILMVEDLKPT